jgi:hypothetical protein
MKKYFISFIMFIIILLLSSICISQTNSPWLEEIDYYTYVAYTGKTVTVAWDPVPNATYYQLRMRLYERKTYTNIDIVPGNTYIYTFQLAKSGHYIIEARSINENNGVITYSEWAESTNPIYATVKSAKRAWWIYCYIAPPGTIIIK